MRVWRIVPILLLAPLSAQAQAALTISPMQINTQLGDTFTVAVHANTGRLLADAAEAQLSFDPTQLSVINISLDNSVLSSWPTPPSFSNEKGMVEFSGWASKQRFSGDAPLITVVFRPLRLGVGRIDFVSGSVLSMSGQETNITESMQGASYQIVPARIDVPPPALSDAKPSTPVPTHKVSTPPEPLSPVVFPTSTSSPDQTASAATFVGGTFAGIATFLIGGAILGAAISLLIFVFGIS